MMPSLADLSLFASLPDRDLRREGIIIAEGRLLAERAAARCEPLGLLCVGAARGDAERIAAGRCPVVEAGEAELSALAGYPFHRGLILASRRPELTSFAAAFSEAFAPAAGAGAKAGPTPAAALRRLLLLPAASDPENLGAMLRSAAALGWDGAVLGGACCDPFGRRVLRCSMGAALSLPLFDAGDSELAKEVEVLKGLGWTVAAANLEADARSPGALGKEEKLALVLGNERFGVPAALRSLCDYAVAIPQGRSDAEGVDSLNVAAAAAILLWEGRAGA